MTDAIASELRSLRKGRGIYTTDLDQRLGPHLRELVAGADDPADGRQALLTELNALTVNIADDLRTAIVASLALAAGTRDMRTFDDRINWLASQLNCAPRTALRRVDAAEPALAEEISRELQRRRGRTPTAPKGWILQEFRTLLRLDTPTPESHEHRTIVATRDGLDEVMLWHNVPGTADNPRPTITGEILYGGRLVRREQPAQNRYQFVVRLPQPLRAGEQHDYGLILRLPEGQTMRPHYVFTPECECHLFDLRVRFNTENPPRWVRRVDAEPVRVFDSGQLHGDPVSLDEAGEIHLRFPNPTMYLGYGAQWWP